MADFVRYFAALEISLAETSVCVVCDDEKAVREAEVANELKALATELGALAGWLCEEMTELRMHERHYRIAIAAMIGVYDK